MASSMLGGAHVVMQLFYVIHGPEGSPPLLGLIETSQSNCHRLTELVFGEVISTVCHWCPAWSEQTRIHGSPGSVRQPIVS